MEDNIFIILDKRAKKIKKEHPDITDESMEYLIGKTIVKDFDDSGRDVPHVDFIADTTVKAIHDFVKYVFGTEELFVIRKKGRKNEGNKNRDTTTLSQNAERDR